MSLSNKGKCLTIHTIPDHFCLVIYEVIFLFNRYNGLSQSNVSTINIFKKNVQLETNAS